MITSFNILNRITILHTLSKRTFNNVSNRTMFKFAAHQGTNIRIVKPILSNVIEYRGYAAVGGRSQIPKEYDTFDKKTWKNVINNTHVQLVTDFNLIYE